MKDVAYYMNLNYKGNVIRLSEEDGGLFEAWIEELGRATCVGVGETEAEAFESLKSIKEFLFEKWIAEGISIPEPKQEIEMPSGRLTLRVPISLHYKLSQCAEENSMPLNTMIVELLSEQLTLKTVMDAIGARDKRTMRQYVEDVFRDIPDCEICNHSKENEDLVTLVA